MNTFTEIAAKWAQQADEVSEIVDGVALLSNRHATLSDGKSDQVGPTKTVVSGILPEKRVTHSPDPTKLSHSTKREAETARPASM